MEIVNKESIWEFGSNIFSNGLINFIIHTCIICIIAKILANIIFKFTESILGSGKEIQRQYLNRVLKVLVYCLALFLILDEVKVLNGIGTAALGATSLISVVLGLAAQETFGNFIAGISLSLTSPFAVGDQISLPEKGITGTVTEITFRHTALTTFVIE